VPFIVEIWSRQRAERLFAVIHFNLSAAPKLVCSRDFPTGGLQGQAGEEQLLILQNGFCMAKDVRGVDRLLVFAVLAFGRSQAICRFDSGLDASQTASQLLSSSQSQ